MTGAVPGYRPSLFGLHFANSFRPGPLVRLNLGIARIPIGNARNGLCGGMAYASRDLFEAGVRPPAAAEPPDSGSPLYRYVVARLFASFGLPWGPLRYLLWQWLPRRDRLGVRSPRWRSIAREWPRVRADIDAGRPSPLGLVRTRLLSPLQLGRNHQVLAYSYDLDEVSDRLFLLVYDPNHPDDDSVGLSLSLSTADSATADIGYVSDEAPVYGFFRTRYRFRRPPGFAAPS
jgi:hypothetical protein